MLHQIVIRSPRGTGAINGALDYYRQWGWHAQSLTPTDDGILVLLATESTPATEAVLAQLSQHDDGASTDFISLAFRCRRRALQANPELGTSMAVIETTRVLGDFLRAWAARTGYQVGPSFERYEARSELLGESTEAAGGSWLEDLGVEDLLSCQLDIVVRHCLAQRTPSKP